MSSTDPGASDAVTRGRECLRQGLLEEAVSHFRAALSANPNNTAVHMMLGVAYSQLARHDEAISSLKQAAELEPGTPSVFYNLGVTYETAGDSAEAEVSYRHALALDPTYALAQKALGALRARRQRPRRPLDQPLSDRPAVSPASDRLPCVSCARQMPAWQRFCPFCGADQQATAAPAVQGEPRIEEPMPAAQVQPPGEMTPPTSAEAVASSPPAGEEQVRRLDEPVAPEPARCQCGAVLAVGLRFCNQCGRPVAGAAGTPLPSAPRFCTQCGAGNPQHTQFCAACGAALGAPSQPISTGGPSWLPRRGTGTLPLGLPVSMRAATRIYYGTVAAMALATFLSWMNAGFSGSVAITQTGGPQIDFQASMNLWQLIRADGGWDWTRFLVLSFFLYPVLGILAERRQDYRARAVSLAVVGGVAVAACLIFWISASRQLSDPRAVAMGLSLHLGAGFFIYLLACLVFLGRSLYAFMEPA